jgi:hypothetical protein
MEFFLPSVLVLLVAAAVVFFVFPRFGATTLAFLSLGLLAFGIYQHVSAFGSEYRLSTWQYDIAGYAPYIMVGGVLAVIAFYLLNLSPLGKANTTAPALPEAPTVANMPPANTATNAVTAGVNNALKGAANAAAAVGLGNAVKGNNKGLAAPAVEAANKVANTAVAAVNKTVNGIGNALAGAANAITGNKPNNKGANQGGLANALGLGGNTKPANNKGTRIPGLNFPLSQA